MQYALVGIMGLIGAFLLGFAVYGALNTIF